jgi:hypothetical protein
MAKPTIAKTHLAKNTFTETQTCKGSKKVVNK